MKPIVLTPIPALSEVPEPERNATVKWLLPLCHQQQEQLGAQAEQMALQSEQRGLLKDEIAVLKRTFSHRLGNPACYLPQQ